MDINHIAVKLYHLILKERFDFDRRFSLINYEHVYNARR